MPIRRRVPKLRKTDWEGVAPDALEWLRGGNPLWEFADAPRDLDFHAFYQKHAARLVAEHVETRPGTRPPMWWEFAAPEPRRRLGGTGELKRGYTARLQSGIPGSSDWAREKLDPRYFGGELPVPVDPLNPPKFESQAAFLKRHRLLLIGQAARLTAADFEPEAVAE